MNVDTAALGFGHFIAHTDAVGKTLLLLLIAMSIASWAIIAIKGLSLSCASRAARPSCSCFWNATSLDAVAAEIATHGVHDPFSHLTAHAMHAQAHHARYGAAQARGSRQRQRVRHAHHQEGARRGDDAAGERPDGAGHRRRDRALRRPVRHGLGRLSRAGGHRHERRRHAGQRRRPGGRGADHDRPGPGGRRAGGDRLQRVEPRQPRADRARWTPSPTSCTPSSAWARRCGHGGNAPARPACSR